MPEIAAGTSIAGRYELVARLDAGGAAEVWEALDAELGRTVAIKILLAPTGADESFLEAFKAEAHAEAALKHPSIVEVFDWGHDGDANYVVMELLQGRTVRRALDDTGPLPWTAVLAAGRQLASAFAYAHAEGFAHGQLTPAQVMLAADGHATLIGFGLSCRGTCEVPPTPDADTYALGALLYEMLTGASPLAARPDDLPADTPWPAPVHTLVHDVPAEFSRIIGRAIAADPAHRYSAAAELQADLDELARPKKGPNQALAVAAAVLVIVAAIALWWFTLAPSIVVPDVTGKTPAEAESILTASGLKIVDAGQTASTAVSTGTIVSESPAAGQHIRRGGGVGVVVSSGVPKVTVPSVVGVTLQAASAQLASAHLAVGTVTRSNSTTYPVDVVISAFPVEGASASVNSRVDLVVSAGQAHVTMPDVRGIDQVPASAKLTKLGLVVSIGQQYSTQPVGTVVTQAPAPGSAVPAGGTAVISISQGKQPVVLPDLVGATTSVARSTLLSLGVVPITSVEASGTHPSKRGIVLTQKPEAGTTVTQGSRVTITIAN